MEALAPGTMIAERYRIESVLGVGGMGVVYEATHLQLAQRVAIKFLLPALCSQHDAVTRFLREGRAAVKLESEHVARVIDVGTLDSGAPYLVMERLEGLVLDTVIAGGRLSVADAVGYLLQAADAIAEAHVLGIIHRDLKPSNLFLARRRDGTSLLKVLDFGISKAALDPTSESPSTRTATAAVMGSPLYMSPEQVRSTRNVDVRTDIWSLGVILYELLTGEHPFQAETLPGVLAMIVADPPIPLRSVRADVPAELERVISKCLQKDRELRYQNVPALARAIAPFAPADSGAVLERIRSFGLHRSSGPPAPAAAARATSAHPLPSAFPDDTTRSWARALAPLGERNVGLVAIAGLATAACFFGYLSWRTPAVTTIPTDAARPPEPATSRQLASAQPVGAPHTGPAAPSATPERPRQIGRSRSSSSSYELPLTTDRWAELESTRAGRVESEVPRLEQGRDQDWLGERK